MSTNNGEVFIYLLKVHILKANVHLYFHLILVQILHIMETQNASKRKYQEIVNQLNAYMGIKKFPLKLQRRLKYFYNKKFNKSYFQEKAILEALSSK